MENVPPVHVDIILDPFIFNVFPRSLLPTAAYILTLAVVSWVISRFIWIGVEGVVDLSKKKGDRGDERWKDGGAGKKDI